MGLSGEWRRVTPDELRQVVDDPSGRYRMVSDAGTGKTFHALAYLLQRVGFPVNIITGEQSLVDDPELDFPFAYLTPQQVQSAAAALAEITVADLLAGVDPADLTREDVYPPVWDRPGELDWAVHPLPHMQAYFAEAARAGDAVLCWVS